jgi:hypothetical protein
MSTKRVLIPCTILARIYLLVGILNYSHDVILFDYVIPDSIRQRNIITKKTNSVALSPRANYTD